MDLDFKLAALSLHASSVRRLIAIAALFVAAGYVGPAVLLAQEPSQFMFGAKPSGAKAQSQPTSTSPPQPEKGHQVPSPDGQFIAYEGKAKDGYHDTIWLDDARTGSTVDLLAPEDQKWPGAGATEILDWLDNDRIAFTFHCGTGCTSLEVVNIKDRSHWYFCTSLRFYLSPDKQYAVGDSEGEGPSGSGGLALIKMKGGHRNWEDVDDCEVIIPGTGVCRPEVEMSDFVKFDHWAPDSKSFTYKVTPCESRISEERVYNLK